MCAAIVREHNIPVVTCLEKQAGYNTDAAWMYVHGEIYCNCLEWCTTVVQKRER